MRKMRLIAAICSLLCALPLWAQDGDAGGPLYTVGVLSAANLYMTYIAIGTIHDGFIAEGYEAEFVVGLSREIIGFCGQSKDAVWDLYIDGYLAGEDEEFARSMVEAYDLLTNLADSLIALTEDRRKSELFQLYRSRAWGKISEILGIGDS